MGFTEKNRILTLSGFLILIVVLLLCTNKSTMFGENFANVDYPAVPSPSYDIDIQDDEDRDKDEVPASIEEHLTTDIPSCLPKDQLMPQELLPQDSESNQWSLANPQGSGSLKDKNFLQSGYHVGINTVGQTLRNANMQLRSDPPNPQVQVSPWLQTTINPDTNRKPFEIGGCA
jgi:hypothetical protein|tara:strand:- start:47 stop:568 length:522 start_codon:yes stop_codon:yes gene_type:complete